MDYEKMIIDRIVSMSGKYSPYNIFSDWVCTCALAVCNACHLVHGKIWQEREKLYCDTISKYSREEQVLFAEMFAWLAYTLEEDPRDVLSDVFMKAGLGSKYTGQFFTPFHLSMLCAKMSFDQMDPDQDGIYRVNEPSCGGGGMVIAMCKAMKDKGINYQKRMEFVAQDLDWKGVYMTYLQLSLLGAKGIVVQGDTLIEPYVEGETNKAHIMETPGKMGVLI